MTSTVGVFVGTRADLGPLQPVIAAMARHPEVDLHLLCGVAFTSTQLSQQLESSGVTGTSFVVHQLAEPIERLDVDLILAQGELLGAGVDAVLREVTLDSLVVLGDRWELLYVVPPAFLAGVRIVHLHGGEVTEGAVDERIRHAITKLADVHCVASPDAADRVAQMGESRSRIHLTGAPGLDRLHGITPLDTVELSELIGADISRPVALFTYHPPTAVTGARPGDWAEEALRAALKHCGSVIVTHPGMDHGREEILEAIARVAESEPGVVVIASLGARYPQVLASVDVVVGNSSSGVIEAASAGVPAVNVGDRQRGRLHGDNVIDTPEGQANVSAAVARALTPAFTESARSVTNPYGDGHAADKIVQAVLGATALDSAKTFIDVG